MSALIGSPVGVLDLSAINQFSQQNTSNVKPSQHQNTANPGGQAPSMDTVKLVSAGAYNIVKPFETETRQAGHERVNSAAIQA